MTTVAIARNAFVCYDTANAVQGADADHSVIVCRPDYVQVDALPAETTAQVQARVHSAAAWVNVGTAITASDGNKLISFDPSPNYVQLVRSGTGAVKAYAQSHQS